MPRAHCQFDWVTFSIVFSLFFYLYDFYLTYRPD